MRAKRRRLSGTWATPSSTIRCGGVAARSMPSMTIDPEVGRMRPDTTRISVVFPAPLGPMTPTASPSRTSSDTSNSAWKLPYPARIDFSSSMGAADVTRRSRSGARGTRARRHRGHGRGLGPEIDLDDTRIARDLSRKALGDLLAMIEHHHAVYDAHQDPHDVLDPDDGDAQLLADPAQQVGGLIHLVLVQAAEALVGQQQLRRRGERLGELQLLQRRRPQSGDRRRAIGRQAHQPERPLRRLEGLRPRAPALSVETREHHVLEDRKPAERPWDLKGATDAEVDDPVRRLAGDLAPLETDRAAVRDQGARQHVEDRALAGPVRADQAQNLALVDHERHVADGREAAEALGEAMDG